MDRQIVPIYPLQPYPNLIARVSQLLLENRPFNEWNTLVQSTRINSNVAQYSAYGYANLPESFYQMVGITNQQTVKESYQIITVLFMLERGYNPNIPDHWGRYVHQIILLNNLLWLNLLNNYNYPVCQPDAANSAISVLQNQLASSVTIGQLFIQEYPGNYGQENLFIDNPIVTSDRLFELLSMDESCHNPDTISYLIDHGDYLISSIRPPYDINNPNDMAELNVIIQAIRQGLPAFDSQRILEDILNYQYMTRNVRAQLVEIQNALIQYYNSTKFEL